MRSTRLFQVHQFQVPIQIRGDLMYQTNRHSSVNTAWRCEKRFRKHNIEIMVSCVFKKQVLGFQNGGCHWHITPGTWLPDNDCFMAGRGRGGIRERGRKNEKYLIEGKWILLLDRKQWWPTHILYDNIDLMLQKALLPFHPAHAITASPSYK